MKVTDIRGKNNVYSSNVYLILGEWKKIEDVNTLIDVGNDPSIIDIIRDIPAGVGKNKVDQVILTHSHSDHTGMLPMLREAFNPRVYAFSPFLEGVDYVLSNGETLVCGDSLFEVIHTPGHTDDSISLYDKKEGVLFVGDTPVIIRSEGGTYSEEFISTIRSLCQRNIQTIYFGHGEPVFEEPHQLLMDSLKNAEAGMKMGF